MSTPSREALREILGESKTIAVIGASDNPARPSHRISMFLMSQGYTVFPVNPGHAELFGVTCYPDLAAIPEPVDVVDIFRRSEAVPPIVDAVIKRGDVKLVWMQDNVYHPGAAEKAQAHGIPTVMNDCIFRFLSSYA